MRKCKGTKKNGGACRSQVVLANGYCRAHQDQAEQETAPLEGVPWTRERLEAAIAEHGGAQGLDLAGANLAGLDLSGLNPHGVVVWRLGLPTEPVQTDLHGVMLLGADLRGAILSGANMQGAELKSADLQGANLAGADLRGADLWNADLQGARLGSSDLSEVDLTEVQSEGLLGVWLCGAKLDRTKLNREQLGPAIGEELAGEYREARDAYHALKQNFDGLGDYEAASWAYVKERQMERACSAPWRARRFYGWEQLGDTYRWLTKEQRSAPEHSLAFYQPRVWWFYVRHTTKWLLDWLVELVCKYGEGPLRTLVSMGVVYALFVAVYWATWAVVREVPEPNGVVDLVPTRNLIDILVFSAGTFTTMEGRGLGPRAPWVQLLATSEALLGIGLTGLLGFVSGNRIRRS